MPRLVYKAEVLLPTFWGWCLILMVLTILTIAYLRKIHDFLAVNDPITAEILVIEGWMRDYALKQAVKEFRSGHYAYIIVTGGPLDRGTELSEYSTFAELTANSLLKMGIDKTEMVILPSEATMRDRTFVTSLEVKKWLQERPEIKAINLMTVGVHARRSRFIFTKTLGSKIKVGIISATYEDYEPASWWRSSIGLRAVISEQIAYIYFRVFWSQP